MNPFNKDLRKTLRETRKKTLGVDKLSKSECDKIDYICKVLFDIPESDDFEVIYKGAKS